MECQKLRPSKTATLNFVPAPRKIGDSLDVALEDHDEVSDIVVQFSGY